MLVNQNTRIMGKNCILVPYKVEHVPKYHQWMQSEELLLLTASEALTLEEEYGMQKHWIVDENKLTFIVLDREKFEQTNDEIASMIGDTNLFFANAEDHICAEAEIMIAEEWARGRQCGSEAMLLMIYYGITKLEVKQFIVKIADENVISIHMFKTFGFKELSHSNVFHEMTLSKIVDESWIKWLEEKLMPFCVENIDEL